MQMTTKETQIEQSLITRLADLKYTYRPDIRDKSSLEQNFRQKFEALNRVHLTDAEFARLRDEIITADVFTAAQALREKGKFVREDGTPLEYMLVNIRDWCKNEFEVINQLRINTGNSYHRYDVKRQNRLLPEHIDKIVGTYQYRKEEPRYSRRVSMAEIEKNDYNLNISRYLSTATVEEKIDLQAVNAELVKCEEKIVASTDRHNQFLMELGLPPLP